MGGEVNANLIGHNLGPYRIVEQIGQGGMATVYKAYEPALDRYVAIKVLPEYFAHDPDFSARFEREAKAVARLNHPNILPIYSFGQEGGLSYIAMRYVGEGTLKDRMGQPLDLETTLHILRQIGQALDCAHRQGIIHRDVKPSNVLMAEGHSQAPGEREWVLLADFGLARMVEGSMQLTKSGVGVGTPAYMSPEQGQGIRVDARSDLYSLGVVLFEMLTGRVPYEAETPLAVVLKHITAPLPMPRSLNPDFPEPAERVILKAMAKNPDDRYQTAQEMVEALERALEETRALGLPSAALPPETLAPAEMPPAPVLEVEAAPAREPVAEVAAVETPPAKVPFVKRVPFWAWGAIGLFVVLLAVGGTLIATGRWPSPGERELAAPTATPLPISRATATVRPSTPTPERRLPAEQEPLGRAVYIEPCEGLVPQQICLRDTESGEVMQLTHDLDFGEFGVFAWSPDGGQIVFNAGVGPDENGGYDHNLYVINADGSDLRQITGGESTDLDPSWSPEGEWIAFHRDCGLWLVHPDGSEPHELLAGSEALCVGGTSWSPDGGRIAFVNWHSEDDIHEIWVVGRDGDDPHVVHAFERAEIWAVVAWSPDGDRLACIFGGERWTEGFVFDPQGGEPEWLGEDELPWDWLSNHRLWEGEWAAVEPRPPAEQGPPGRWVVVGTCEGLVPWQICIHDTESGEAMQLTHDLDFGEQGAFAWSPDGGQIVFNAGVGPDENGGYDHNLYVINADGSDLRQITGGQSTDLDPSWSPDGEWIAFHRDCGLWLVHPDGSELHELLAGSEALCVGGTSWSPDGGRIAFVNWHSEDDIHEIWVVGREGSDPHVVHAFERALEWFISAWSPDGERLACIYGGEGWTEGFVFDPQGGEPEGVAEDRLPWFWFPNHRPWEGEWAAVEPRPPAERQLPRRPAFVEQCQDLWPPQICVRDEESDQVTQLTHDLEFERLEWWKSWSPDGGQIVFSAGSNPDDSGVYDHKLYVINADGSDLRQITEGDVNDAHPSWSPDGEWIAFHRDCGLWIVHPDGIGAHELVAGTDELCIAAPAWSPDGARIAFQNWAAEPNAYEAWMVGRTGREPRMVRAFEQRVEWFNVVWSPDGGRLACIFGVADGAEGILIASDGRDLRPIPQEELPWTWYPNYWPQWSGGDLRPASGPIPEDPWGSIVVPPGGAIGIGLVADFSGPARQLGPLFENAVHMAVEDQGDVAGFPAGVVVADGGCGEEMGVAAAQSLIGDPAIAGVVGHSCSASCRAALPVYEEAHYVVISPSCTGTDLSVPGYAAFNRVALRDDQGGDQRNREIVATGPYRDFAARYEERWGQPLDGDGQGFNAAYAYDAAAVLLSAIARVAVVDDTGTLVVGRQALAEAVRGVPDYPGVTGLIRFDERGDRVP